MEHDAFHVPYLLDTTPEATFHGQAVKTVAYLWVSTTQQVLGPEARTPEGLAGRLTARWQGGRNPALPRTGRFQDRHCQVWACPVPPSTAHEHPRAQAEPLACISTRILSVPKDELGLEDAAELAGRSVEAILRPMAYQTIECAHRCPSAPRAGTAAPVRGVALLSARHVRRER